MVSLEREILSRWGQMKTHFCQLYAAATLHTLFELRIQFFHFFSSRATKFSPP